jgi:hypothetical protein
MGMSNCLLFYLELRRRRLARGKRGGVFIRKSLHWWGPHFIYQYKNRFGRFRQVHFVPVRPEVGRLFPPWKFAGRVKWGDG